MDLSHKTLVIRDSGHWSSDTVGSHSADFCFFRYISKKLNRPCLTFLHIDSMWLNFVKIKYSPG